MTLRKQSMRILTDLVIAYIDSMSLWKYIPPIRVDVRVWRKSVLAGGFDVEQAVQEESARCLYDAVYARLNHSEVLSGMEDLEVYEQKCMRGMCDKMVKLLGTPVEAITQLTTLCLDTPSELGKGAWNIYVPLVYVPGVAVDVNKVAKSCMHLLQRGDSHRPILMLLEAVSDRLSAQSVHLLSGTLPPLDLMIQICWRKKCWRLTRRRWIAFPFRLRFWTVSSTTLPTCTRRVKIF
jgi:hypothetical protein